MLSTPILISVVLCALVYLTSNYVTVSRSIPGPLLARFTNFWRAYNQYNGRLRSKLIALHAQNGEVVRYGINAVSISDPTAIHLLYESREPFLIAPSYDVLVGVSNGKEVPSVVSTRDESRHGQLRRSVANAFTSNGVESYEAPVDATIHDLLGVLDRKLGRAIDLPDVLLQYSMDVAYRMTFSESLGCLEAGGDVDNSIAIVRDRLQYWGVWSSLPWLERLIYRNPWAIRQSKGKTPSGLVTRAASRLAVRMKEENASQHDWLNHFMSAHEANPGLLNEQGVVSLIMSTISGAGDTTATTVAATLFYLINHPEELTKLRTELTDAGIDGKEVPSIEASGKLPYLAAVIKESMRLFPLITWPTERLVPPGGRTIAGHFFAEGTSVGIFTPALHLNKNVYGDDATDFRPERWLETDQDKLKSMDRAFMGFSRGKRVCLGQNVALMSMKKLLPMLVMCYDMELVNKDAKLEANMSSSVAFLDPLMTVLERRI